MPCQCSPWSNSAGEARKVCGDAPGPNRSRVHFQGTVYGARGRWPVLLSTYRGSLLIGRSAEGPFVTKALAKRVAARWLREKCEFEHGPGFAGRCNKRRG